MERSWIIYCILCVPTGKEYIGITNKTLRNRWVNHVWGSRSSKPLRRLLPKAIRKYGESQFALSELARAATAEEAKEAERRFIAERMTFMPNGMNMTAGGDGTPGRRFSHSAETRAKIGRKGRTFSAETKRRMSEAKRGWSPPESLRKIVRDTQQGRIRSADTRAKMAAAVRGRKFPNRSIALLESASWSRNASGFRGVTPEGKHWTARIGINGRRVHLGVFDTPEAAYASYQRAVRLRIEALKEQK